MSVETETLNPSERGTTAEQGAGKYDQFLGVEPDMDLDAEEETPETPSAEEESEESDADSEPEVETEGEESEEEDAETDSIEEWLEDLTQREIKTYSQRYPSAWKQLTNPDTPEDIKHLLRDKINSDRLIEQKGYLQAETEEAPILEEEPAEEEVPVQEAPLDPVKAREQHYQEVDALAKTLDPQALEQLGQGMLQAFGVDLAKLNDPNLTPEAKAELQALAKTAPAIGQTLGRGAIDLISTVLPRLMEQLLPGITEKLYPGSSQSWERQMYSGAWDGIKNQSVNGEKPYANLPAFGTPEFQSVLAKAAVKVAGSEEAFDAMVFTDKSGKPLPVAQQAQKKYTMLAKAAAGEKVNPAVVSQAIEKGKEIAGKSARKRAAGQALGAGHSTKTFGGQSEDPVMDDLDKELGIANAAMKPFGSGKSRRK